MMEKPSKFKAVLIGGIAIGLISGLPFISIINCCCCAGILFGGALAVYFYKKEFTDDTFKIETSDALMVGLLSGLIGAVISVFLGTIFKVILGPEIFASMEQVLDQLESQGNMPSEFFDSLRAYLVQGVTVLSLFVELIFAAFLYGLFGLLGGLIGYGMFCKKKNVA